MRTFADLQASSAGNRRNLAAHTDAAVHAHVGLAAIPLDGVLHANYTAPAGGVQLRQSYLRTPRTSIEPNGTISGRLPPNPAGSWAAIALTHSSLKRQGR